MESRRKFLKASAAAMAVAATKPLFGIQGANDRVRLAVIGCGNRSGRVFDSFARQSNVQWVAGAEDDLDRQILQGPLDVADAVVLVFGKRLVL